jgi:hypothetical protein
MIMGVVHFFCTYESYGGYEVMYELLARSSI